MRCRFQRSINAPTTKPSRRYGATLSALKTPIWNGVAAITLTARTWNATAATEVPKARMVVALQKRANAGMRSTSLG